MPRSPKPRILMIGALPPPAIGPYLAMQRLIESRLLNDVFTVDFLDISDRRAPTNIGCFDLHNLFLGLKHAGQCLGRLLLRPPAVVYLGISQGTWGYLRDLSFIIPALCLRRRLVLHLRGSEFRAYYDSMPGWLQWLTRWVLRRTDRMIVLGESLKSVFTGLIPPGRLVAIANGIACDEFPARPSRTLGKRILFLSSLRRRKGLFLLLESLPTLFARHPDAIITFAGLWQSDAERVEANALIARLSLQDRLNFVGEVTGTAKLDLFQQHDVFAFPPVEPEGLPWVILEAMSAALPVVTTNQGAIADVVTDQTGFIVSPTPAAVADRLGYLLDHPEEAQAMGRAGRARVEAEFSEAAYLARLLDVFRAAAGATPAVTTALAGPQSLTTGTSANQSPPAA